MLDGLLGENHAPTEIELQIQELLKALHAEPARSENFVQLIPLALQYVLRHPDVATNAAIPASDARFKSHQFCHRCATQRGIEDPTRGAEQNFRLLLQTCMLRGLSYKIKRPIEIWLSGLANAIFDCIDCYKGYLKAKRQLGPNFLHTYDAEKIEHFLGFILEWEERAATAIVEESNVSGESSKLPLSNEQTYSIFDLAGVLKSKNKINGLYDKMRRGRKYIALNRIPEAPSGLLAFAVDEEEPVRVWAEMQWAVPPMSRESSTENKTIGNLVRLAIEHQQWNGFAFIVKLAPEAFVGAALANTLLAHLSPDANASIGILTCLRRLLGDRGTSFWAHEDRELPLVLLSSILDNKDFVRCLADNPQRQELWNWIDTWVTSLKDRLLSQHENVREAEADAKVYEETLKRLAHFLLERFQQGGHSDVAKNAAIGRAVTIIQSCIGDATEEDASKHIWQAVVRVAALHAPTLARRAFEKHSNTLQGFGATELSTKTQALLETIFQHDCVAFSESLLTLSEVTAASQTAYKRATKPRVLPDGTRSTDEAANTKAVVEALEKTRDELNLDPLVCSELWKASYSAIRGGNGLHVLLRPLQKIAALVEPQINSHIVIVKERHGALPAYVQYKERLKSVILIHSRRISAMRGNLPALLLEASELSSTQSSQVSSTDATTICYKYADGILAANLCPQQDVHKAAQNIVRAAFEDAESRGDCFRSLLQCNPLSSLQGINNFLTEFLTAAARLVEANDAAKWMVRSFSDIIDALCSETEGLLRQGVPGCLLSRTDILPEVRKELSRMWTSISKSIAVIFKRTPHWARVLPHAELTAWFRDVSLFAREALAELPVFREALTWGLDKTDKGAARARVDMLNDLALPLEEASSWLRMNNAEIVQETREYFVKGLQAFKRADLELPEAAKKRMLDFIDAQSKITRDEERMTLLSLDELQELRHLLDPRSQAVEILDSDEEQEDSGSDRPLAEVASQFQNSAISKADTSSATRSESKGDAWGSLLKAQSLSSALAKGSSKQSKLTFSSVDSREAISKPFVSKPAPTPPPPRTASTSGAANKYQGASTRYAAPARPSGKLAQLRQDFNANSAHRPPAPSISHASGSRELPEPAAPEAKRSFATSQPATSNGRAPHTAPKQDQSSDESDSSDEEPKVGLAEMGQKKKSPVKMRPKSRFVPNQPPQRRTIMLENIEARRAQREREEAERKRKLREPVNLNPLHRTILSWRYWTEGDKPPAPPDGPPPQYEALRSTYASPEEYQAVLQPMLQLECWAELQGAKEQIARGNPDFAALTATVNGRNNTDGFVVLTMTLAEDRRIQNGLFQDTDVLFVQSAETGEGGRRKTVLGKVQAFKNDPKGPRLTLRCSLAADTQQMSSALVSNSVIQIGKLFSLVTTHRAYEALQTVTYFDLLPNILLSRAAVRENVTPAEIQEAEKSFGVNPPQAEAICSAIKAEQGFHLIQGPPGTGKTKTIASLVAHFMRTRKAPAVPIRTANATPSHLNSAPIKQKILLCAPSNAAVDEVARRVQTEVKLPDGRVLRPSVVRLGRDQAISAAVKDISLDSIVERRMGTSSSSDGATVDPAQLQQEVRMLKDQRDMKRAQIEVARQEGQNDKVIAQLEAEMRNLSSKRMDVMSRLDEARDKKQTMTRQHDADRRRIQQEVMLQADVVCATLGGAGHQSLSSLPLDFETVIIDEAAQAVELDTLIPLRYGCKKCIMVGDPNQLPPTVISREAERLKYSRSLFVRLFDNPKNFSHLLSIQYRMHPRISAFPNVAFYQGKLQDGPGMGELMARPWHNDPLLGALRFVDSRYGREFAGRGGLSFTNRDEAELAAAIFERLHREARRTNLGVQAVEGKIGVVTMYKEQVFELRRTFQRVFGAMAEAVDFNTVDGFQGQEKDIIILSCVRTNGIGFLNDFRRINVAITRAKCNLFVIGDVSNLERNDREGFWRRSIEAARKNGDLIVASVDDYRRQYIPPPGPPPTLPQHSTADMRPPYVAEPAQGSYSHSTSYTHGEKRTHANDNDDQRRKKKKKRRDNGRQDRSMTFEEGEVDDDQRTNQRDHAPSASSRSSSGRSTPNNQRPPPRPYDDHGLPPRPPRPEYASGPGVRPRAPRSPARAAPPPAASTTAASADRPQATRIAIPGEDEAPAKAVRPRPGGPRPPSFQPGPLAHGAVNPRAIAASRPPPRPRPPPQGRPENGLPGVAPSDRAKASLFIPKRPAQRPRPRPQ